MRAGTVACPVPTHHPIQHNIWPVSVEGASEMCAKEQVQVAIVTKGHIRTQQWTVTHKETNVRGAPCIDTNVGS